MAALATVAVLALAGCGGSGGGTSDGRTTSATPSTSPSPSATASATPAWTKTKASSRQFAVYFLKTLLHAYVARDMTQVQKLADPATCKACKQSAASVQELIQHKYVETYDGPIEVTKTTSFDNLPGGVYDVLVVFDIPAGHEVSDSGKVIDKVDAGRGSKFEAYVTWAGTGWQIRDYELRVTDTP